jgi:hypothetical protein
VINLAFKQFEPYINSLAKGKLDYHFDEIFHDKKHKSNSTMSTSPSLLLHHLGNGINNERVKDLFIEETVFVILTLIVANQLIFI